MSLRDESFHAMLGREPSSTEWTDIERLQRATGMNKDEAFWGVIAYLYARTRPDIEAREQLRLVIESLKDFGERLNQGMQSDRLVAPITTALHSVLAEEPGLRVDTRTLSATIETALRNAGPPPRSSLRDWCGEHLAAALYTVAGLFTSGLLAMGLSYWTGTLAGTRATHAADQAVLANLRTHAGPIRAWALSHAGQRVYAWGQLNRQSLEHLLSCNYPGWRRRPQDGYVVCYPNGSGHGFYLPPP